MRGSLLWGSAVEFASDAVAFLHRQRARHGNVFTIRLVNQYLTVLMDPHSHDAVTSERRFTFDPIQKQVNWNVFGFVIRDPKRMIRITGRSVHGQALRESMEFFNRNLEIACDAVDLDAAAETGEDAAGGGLQTFVTKTMFDAVFNTAFGRPSTADEKFQSSLVYDDFETFHCYFNYIWLGLPKRLFPAALRALDRLLVMRSSFDQLRRPDLSTYLHAAVGCMLEHVNTEAAIKGHNLHVNHNTVRLAFWALANIVSDADALAAVRREVDELLETFLNPRTNTASVGAIGPGDNEDYRWVETC